MAKFNLIKKGEAYFPAYSSDYEKSKKVPQGAMTENSFKHNRNYQNHKRFFAMLDMTSNHLPEGIHERYLDPECLRREALIQVGHCEMHVLLDGTIHLQAKSIKYEDVDEDEFQKLYGLVANWILKNILTDWEEEIFNRNINLFM